MPCDVMFFCRDVMSRIRILLVPSDKSHTTKANVLLLRWCFYASESYRLTYLKWDIGQHPMFY